MDTPFTFQEPAAVAAAVGSTFLYGTGSAVGRRGTGGGGSSVDERPPLQNLGADTPFTNQEPPQYYSARCGGLHLPPR
ncbi:hypothetical protein GCM10023080_005340 [Streptomyces pseudoechinosporeus]